MDIKSFNVERIHRFFSGGLNFVEYVGLLIIGLATTVAIYTEVMTMIRMQQVLLHDLLLMFLYLEVLAMIGQYFKHGHVPVRYPIYIAMMALARYLILDIKSMSEMRLLSTSISILLLTLAVLSIRYGHVRFPYGEDKVNTKPYGIE